MRALPRLRANDREVQQDAAGNLGVSPNYLFLQAVRKLHQRSAGWGKKAERCPLSGPQWEEMAIGVQKSLL